MTDIVVLGEVTMNYTPRYTDKRYTKCRVDDYPRSLLITITIRYREKESLEIDEPKMTVYVNGNRPLYRTYVYDSDANLLAVDDGLVTFSQTEAYANLGLDGSSGGKS